MAAARAGRPGFVALTLAKLIALDKTGNYNYLLLCVLLGSGSSITIKFRFHFGTSSDLTIT